MRITLPSVFSKTLDIAVYNQIVAAMNAVTVDGDMFEQNSFGYRHLLEPPEFLLNRYFKGSDLAAVPADGNWHVDDTKFLEFVPSSSKYNSFVFTAYYRPFGMGHHNSGIAIYKRNIATGFWVQCPATVVRFGITKVDGHLSANFAVSGGGGGPQTHYYTGVPGWWPYSATHMKHCMTTAVFGPTGDSSALGFDRYAIGVRVEAGTDGVHDEDRIILVGVGKRET